MGPLATPYDRQSDERLMERVVRGDERAFAALYDRYSQRLLVYFHRMLWSDRELARDMLQDLFAKLAERPGLYDPQRPFRTWLFSAANNMCKNAYRHAEVVRRAGRDLRHNGEEHSLQDGGRAVDHGRFSDRLAEELDKLDPDHKATFVMRFQEDLAIKEIAAAFNCSEGTVKSRIFYTLKKLSGRLKEFGPQAMSPHGPPRTL